MYHVGQLLEVTCGDFKGQTLCVKEIFEGSNGTQVVLQSRQAGGDKWWDFCRESESEVARFTKNATQYENFYQYENESSNHHGGPFDSLDAARTFARKMLDGDASGTMLRVEIRNRSSNVPMPMPYGDTVEVVRRRLRTETVVLDKLRRNGDQDVVFATTEILGASFHVQFVRVQDAGDGGLQEPTNDPEDYYHDMLDADIGGSFQTVKLPGYDGDWVMMIYPFTR